MKRALFLIVLLFSFFKSDATHIMGGEITWTCIKDPSSPDLGKYIFQMKLYRDCSGNALQTIAQNIKVWEDGVNFQTISCDFVINSDISPICDATNSGNPQLDCTLQTPGAVEEYIYQSLPVQLIVPPSGNTSPPATGWHFTWDGCCRNDAISNLDLTIIVPTGATEGFTLRASMFPYTDEFGNLIPADPCFDSSPTFNENPKTIICSGYPFAYSHNASDPELDSIRYYWAEPLDYPANPYLPGVNPPAIPFIPPYTFNAPLPGSPTLNPVTGEVSYDSPLSGNFVTVVRVVAFKCGQKISEVHRDIQAVLIACPTMPLSNNNTPPEVPTPIGTQTWVVSTGSSLLETYETTVLAGDLVTFNVQGIDTNMYNPTTPQDLTMEISGGQILDPTTGTCSNPPCATFLSTSGTPPPIIQPTTVEGVFQWQTTCVHVSSDIACGRTTNLYQFSIKVSDDFCPAPAIRNVTLLIYVEVDNQMQFSHIDPSCFGNDGEITIDIAGSIAQSTWSAELLDFSGNIVVSSNNISGNNHTLTGLASGEYILRATGGGGCLVQDTVVLSQPINPLVMETNVTHVSCYGGSDAEIGIYLDNGLLPYSFFIDGVQNPNPPPGDSVFSGLSAGVYVIEVADSDSCGLVETIYIDAPLFPLQVLTSNLVTICDDSLGGVVYGYAAGGSPSVSDGYLFDWYNASGGLLSSGDSISGLGVGDYFLEVTDSNGCQANQPITVSAQQAPLSLIPDVSGVVCTGDSTGSAIFFTGGGSAPYSYVWSELNGPVLEVTNNIINRDTLSDLLAGSYHLVVTDANGCAEDMSFTIDEPSLRLEISSVAVVDSIDCYGDLNGRGIVYMVSGSGVAPYNYLWDNGETTQEALSLGGGWHTVQVSDSRGCVVIDSLDMPENTEIKSDLVITDSISCYGDSDGSIEVSTIGGVHLSSILNYEYFWSDGSVDVLFIDSLSYGSYYLTTRDSLGCVVVDSIYLPEPTPLYVNAEEILEATCYDSATATAYAAVVGGTAPYDFYWQLGSAPSFTNTSNDSDFVSTLNAGQWNVFVYDSRGCFGNDSVMIHEPDELEVSISDSVLVYCVGINTGSATASVIGGTAPYTYLWDDNLVVPQTTQTAVDLDAGSYMVFVEDARGCTSSVGVVLDSVTLAMEVIIDTVSSSSIGCYGGNDGMLVANGVSGFWPYTYQWTGPTGFSVNDTIFNLTAGTYSVTVTDANGCTVNASQQLTEPNELRYTVNATVNTSCLGACDGLVVLDIEGGVAPYTADLLDNQTGLLSTHVVNVLGQAIEVCTGDYTVFINDAHDCAAVLILGGSDQATLDITVNTDVSVSQQPIICYGDSLGSVSVVNPQAGMSYSYLWENANGDTVGVGATVDSLPAGDYTLYSGYNNITGCTTTDVITILQNSLIQSTATVIDVSCNGGSDGSITTTTYGGSSPYSYSWSSSLGSLSDITGLSSGSYELTIMDDDSCSVTETYVVGEPASLNVTVSASQTYILNTTVTGGTAPYSYQWYSGTSISGATSDSYTVGANGTYYVEVTDANNCTSLSNSETFLETGLSDLTSSIDVSIYPNPFRDATMVDFGKKINQGVIKIVDVYGKVIEMYDFIDIDHYIIERGSKASGIYFVEIEINEQYLSTIKLIVE